MPVAAEPVMRTTPSIGISLLALALVLPSVAAAKPRCAGAFKKTCLKTLFSCFKPVGACTTETTLSPDFLHTSVTTCWENGTFTVSAYDVQTRTGTLTVANGKGKVCTTASVVSDEVGVESTYVRGRKRWVISTANDGTLIVTCPSGRVETYPVADLAQAQPGCLGRSAAPCRAGSCS
jgi:hypothetical protein